MQYFFFLFMLLVSSIPSWSSAEAMRTHYAVDTMDELLVLLGNAPGTSFVGLDCDNTLVLDEAAGIYDFEMAREHALYWVMAGEEAARQNEFLGSPKAFPATCISLTKHLPAQFRLVDEGLPALDKSLWDKGIETFVCTGLRPCEEKREYLKENGLNWDMRYDALSHVSTLFFEGAPGWLYARGNKAPALHAFVEARNKDRAAQGLAPVTDLYFVDNHLETLQDIERVFSHTDVKLHLIHWRKHALDLAREYNEGRLINRIVDGYKALLVPAFLTQQDDDEGYHSPSPYENCGYDTGSPLCSPVRIEEIMKSPMRPTMAS